MTFSPYHTAINGLTERTIHTFKEIMKRQKTGFIETRIARFLFAYCNTPRSTTGVSPAVILVARQI